MKFSEWLLDNEEKLDLKIDTIGVGSAFENFKLISIFKNEAKEAVFLPLLC